MRLTHVLFARGSARFKLGELTKKYANLPESYMEECMKRVYWRTPKGINYRKREYTDGVTILGLHRPWSFEALKENSELQKQPYPYVEPIRDWLFFRGDRVQVLYGKDKGKQGIVTSVIQERNWVIVKGLNTQIEEQKSEDSEPVYTLVERPLLVTTQVALVDPGDLQPTKAEWAYTEEGEKIRISTRTGRTIPFSVMSEETYDYKMKAAYTDSPKDTAPQDMNVTFQPQLKTFEMDIAEQHGIQEDRTPAKTYVY